MSNQFELQAGGYGTTNSGGMLAMRRRAQDLHEQMFGEKASLDASRLSLSQQKFLNDAAAQIEKSTLARARYLDSIKRNISAAAGMEKLSAIDRSSPNFDKQVSAVVSQYPEALGSSAFLKLLQDARSDR